MGVHLNLWIGVGIYASWKTAVIFQSTSRRSQTEVMESVNIYWDICMYLMYYELTSVYLRVFFLVLTL